MAPKPKPPPIWLPPASSLLPQIHLLTLFHHRNRSQHRLSTWYRPFLLLLRNLRRLHAQLADPDVAFRKNKEAAAERVQFVRDVLLVKAYEAAGALCAENMFAQLGLFLVGVLARVWKVLEDPEERRRREEGEGEGKEKEEVVMGAARLVSGLEEDVGERISRQEVLGEVDVGERVEREAASKETKEVSISAPSSPAPQKIKEKKRKLSPEDEDTHSASSAQAPKKSSKSSSATEAAKKKKKKKKGGDAFDDIFSGLV
jgi:ribonuclease MRP protein subunit RMP1